MVIAITIIYIKATLFEHIYMYVYCVKCHIPHIVTCLNLLQIFQVMNDVILGLSREMGRYGTIQVMLQVFLWEALTLLWLVSLWCRTLSTRGRSHNIFLPVSALSGNECERLAGWLLWKCHYQDDIAARQRRTCSVLHSHGPQKAPERLHCVQSHREGKWTEDDS